MKEKIKKTASFCKGIFGYGILICLFAGGLTFLGYIAAFIIGGQMAGEICVFIYKKIIPAIIYLSNIMILLGIFSMYLSGEYALTINPKK